jgi:hypothetical protein
VPLRSKAQQRFMFAAEARGDLPEGTARRWARHTPAIKSLPERAGGDKADGDKKAAFLARFVAECQARQLTVKQAADLAEAMAKEALDVTPAAPNVTGPLETLARTVAGAGFLGTVGVPALAGGIAGSGLALLRNQTESADTDTLRRMVLARAYRRRESQLTAKQDLAAMQRQNPGKYVVLG